jgi:PAS domain S-box-containing protein
VAYSGRHLDAAGEHPMDVRIAAMTEQGLVLADRDGCIRFWNDIATELFGHRATDAVGASLDLIVPHAFRERHWVGYRRAWAEGIADSRRVAMMPVLCADGEVRRFAGHLLPVKGPHGALAAIAGIYSAHTDGDADLFVMG